MSTEIQTQPQAQPRKKSKIHLMILSIVEGALMVALAQVLGYLKFFPSLSEGGSITFVMFPICLYAVRWGLGKGLLASFALGLLQLLLDGAYAWGWQCMLLDYLLAYTMLGFAGIFRGKKWGIFPGILVGGLARFLMHFISGATLYRIVAPTEILHFGTFSNPEIYSLVYNGTYMLPCIVLSLAVAGVLFVPLKKYFTAADLR